MLLGDHTTIFTELEIGLFDTYRILSNNSFLFDFRHGGKYLWETHNLSEMALIFLFLTIWLTC